MTEFERQSFKIKQKAADSNSIMARLMPDESKMILNDQCPSCGLTINEETFKDKPAIELREFGITGICHDCQDKLYGESDEE